MRMRRVEKMISSTGTGKWCCCVSTSTDNLRTQLDQLHSEAHFTRTKANNARFRLLRLSEAAENLCRQAALSVRKGKEDDARELLLQKRKIMFALERSKARVELLDELAAKLNEAISIKEAQLVKNVTSDLDIDEDNCEGEGPVRIVYPTQDNRKTFDENYYMTSNKFDDEDQDLVSDVQNEENVPSYIESEDEFPDLNRKRSEMRMFRGSSSYIDFLKDLDQQLDKIENDLTVVLKHPTLEIENEKPAESNLKQVEILKNIREARLRIQDYVQEISQTS